MNAEQFIEKMKSDVNEALKSFGTYSFSDKGPSEVMEISDTINDFKKLIEATSVEKAFDALVEAARIIPKDRGLMVASEVMLDLQDDDAIFSDPRAEMLLDHVLPDNQQAEKKEAPKEAKKEQKAFSIVRRAGH